MRTLNEDLVMNRCHLILYDNVGRLGLDVIGVVNYFKGRVLNFLHSDLKLLRQLLIFLLCLGARTYDSRDFIQIRWLLRSSFIL